MKKHKNPKMSGKFVKKNTQTAFRRTTTIINNDKGELEILRCLQLAIIKHQESLDDSNLSAAKYKNEKYTNKKGDLVDRILKQDGTLKYEGEIKDSLLEGFGDWYYENGDKYCGEWKANKKNGYGKYFYNDGHLYEGNFKDDRRDTNYSGFLIEKIHYLFIIL